MIYTDRMNQARDNRMQLSPAQQDEVRRRLANPSPLVPEREMEAFFRRLVE